MKLEKQVCSLELSKRLKELGFEQESYFKYMEANGKYVLMEGYPISNFCSAYTVAELGEMLPSDFHTNRIEMPTKEVGVKKNEYHCWAWNFKNPQFGDTEANARAKMLIYLKENK